jgi:hypothetical protein
MSADKENQAELRVQNQVDKEPIGSFFRMKLLSCLRVMQSQHEVALEYLTQRTLRIITSIADQAFACATNSMGVSIAAQFNVHFVAAAPGDELTAEGRVLQGRRVDVCEIAVTNQEEVIARATGTAIPMA